MYYQVSAGHRIDQNVVLVLALVRVLVRVLVLVLVLVLVNIPYHAEVCRAKQRASPAMAPNQKRENQK